MKRYQFRLEAVLKMRKMHEETCRSALGLMMVEREGILATIEGTKADIQQIYLEQETQLQTGMKASQVAFFPYAVAGKEARIKVVMAELDEVDKRIEEKKRELSQKRAELKLIENLRQKDFEQWRKAYNKENDLKVEEMVRLWDESRKGQEVP